MTSTKRPHPPTNTSTHAHTLLTAPPVNLFCISVIFSMLKSDCARAASAYIWTQGSTLITCILIEADNTINLRPWATYYKLPLSCVRWQHLHGLPSSWKSCSYRDVCDLRFIYVCVDITARWFVNHAQIRGVQQGHATDDFLLKNTPIELWT